MCRARGGCAHARNRAQRSHTNPHRSVRARTFSIEGVNLATDLDDALRTNLSPQRVIEDASGSEDRFLARYGDTQLLLVKLQTGAEALEMGLSVSQRSALSRVQPSIRVMGFET